ncbi:MAG: helicase [Deltaproteobacteria bacterium]|nr:helicase [Deltaproteobacteria bacterium]MDL1961953.1 helicase [Deltaproteobacteria bacterium]
MEKYAHLYSEPRDRLVSWVKTRLVGPGPDPKDVTESNDTINGIRPSMLYPTGILFPVIKGESGIDPSTESEPEEEIEDTQSPSEEETESDKFGHSSTKQRRYIAPSAAGFSFYASQDIEIHVFPWAVRYEKTSKREHRWERIPLCRYEDVYVVLTAPTEQPIKQKQIREKIWPNVEDKKRAEIFTLWRPHGKGWLITVTLCNRQQCDNTQQKASEREWELEEKSLFEVELRCDIVKGKIYPYPRKDPSLLDDEERELELQYRHKRIYGIGHGAAVDWKIKKKKEKEEETVSTLKLAFLPMVEVPQITPNNSAIDPNTLSLKFLSRSGHDAEKKVCPALDDFVAAYAGWQQEQRKALDDLDEHEKSDGDRILKRIKIAVSRMEQGVDLLRKDQKVAQAFALANDAMLKQWEQCDRTRGQEPPPHSWRPFQLGFLLLTLESVVNADDKNRDTVDLIWFPTGGGKTEAYLALTAFQIIWRRMRYRSSGGGTTVIMRYTLRLLTQQQFQRASRLICALELMRRESPGLLGNEPITAGMWVGSETSPNRFKDAVEEISKEAFSAQPPRKFVLTECPWCGHSLWNSRGETVKHGFKVTQSSFHLLCQNRECGFYHEGNGVLPLNVVDEALYKQPPTLLFATVDKFARLAWDERTSAFFGKEGQRPPELIIQDELHLIAGALGSIVGIYEAALYTVLIQRGICPKYIASTATIRNASRQIKRLYGRENLAIFPPPGLSAEDSFFTRTVPVDEKPGRLYIGYLASAMKRRDAFAVLSAALLAAPLIQFSDDKELLDAWWTLLVYHGSLRGVGDSHNALQYFSSEYLRRNLDPSISNGKEGPEDKAKDTEGRSRDNKIAQLTSVMSSEENSQTFAQLEKSCEEADYLDAVLATNMISVGLDVGRLALMIINGQPLTTAEYIQSSSRVGRSDVPGIIFTNYYRTQARSLSHYEDFRPYHESFYRFVEPTSVTPFTSQARKRALHAALVIVMRHSIGFLRANDSANKFDPTNSVIKQAINALAKRCQQADCGHAEETQTHLKSLSNAWTEYVQECKHNERKLVYQQASNDRANDPLLYTHQDSIQGLWETLHSMRNVEDTGLMRVTGLFDPPDGEHDG